MMRYRGDVAAVLSVLAIYQAFAVDVFVGSIEPGHTTPAAAAPFGMVQAGPDTSPTQDRFEPGKAHTGGYDYRDGWVWRFSQMRVSGTGCCAFGDFGILPYADGFDGEHRPAKLVKESECAEPGFYAVSIDEDGTSITVEIAALAKSAVYRFRYPTGKRAKLLFDLDWGLEGPDSESCFGRKIYWSKCQFESPKAFGGGRKARIWNDYTVHFACETSRPVLSRRQVRAADGLRGEIWELDFGPLEDGVLELRIGLSFGSEEKAAGNLAVGAKGMDFESVRRKSAYDWEAVLSRVELDPATPRETAENFRSALYRLCLQPNDLADEDARPAYSTLSLWDTFRAAHPFYTILVPERVPGMVNSMLDQYDRQGYLPIWALGGGENHCMIGHHAVPVIVDACLKGFPGIDRERAFSAIRDSLTKNHDPSGDGTWGLMKEDWDLLDKYGYYPFDKMRGSYRGRPVRGESVSRTLECAYDDACAARLAHFLGKKDDEAFFSRRAGNWRNVYDPSTGFMRGRDSRGNWREPFSPWALGAGPWRDNDFCEGNSWQYTWHVMQDAEGLIGAMGGRDRFVARLESLFAARPLTEADGASYDVSGLIGQYAHGNEPSHHVIYFFALAGRPDLTAKWVREVCETQYHPRPDGLTGNDDCGQMAAWYVFSALGFYPFDPCGGEYVLGAPQVPAAQMRVGGEGEQRTFRILAKGLSRENKYVKSVMFNGKPLKGWKISHRDIMAGGELVFEMASELQLDTSRPSVREVSRYADEDGVVRAVVFAVAGDEEDSHEAILKKLKEAVWESDAEAPWAVKLVSSEGLGEDLREKIESYASNKDFDWRKARVKVVEPTALSEEIRKLIKPHSRGVSLDGTWEFRREIVVSPDGREEALDTGWEAVRVPHDWAIGSAFIPKGDPGTGKLPWRGAGRYRRTFSLDKRDVGNCQDGGKVYLEFDGVMARPEVFVNGSKAGGWDYGYMSFVVDATRFVKSGANELEVFCDTRPHKSRWYPGGGIFRSARMKVMPPDHVVPNTMAIVAEDVTVTNAQIRVRYVSSLRGPQERSFSLRNPRLWDVEDPYLYEMRVLGESFRYGVRKIKWTADDGFHLNGRRVQLKGVNLHSDMGPLGMAFDKSVMRRQLRIMKDMGVNAIRTSHNAPAPQLLELCDEMGFLVWDECFDKWDGTASRRDDENLEEYIGRNLVAFVRRDRNHPSVIAWSQSNEVAPANSFFPSGLTRERCALFKDLMRAEDVSRPIGNGNVSHQCNPRLIEEPIHADLDILGWNYAESYKLPHERYPDKPLVYTESASAVSSYGAYENPPSGSKNDWPQSVGDIGAYDHTCGPDIPDVEFSRMEADTYCAGEFVWTGIDYLGEPFPYTKTNLGRKRRIAIESLSRSSYFGVCDLNGFPKDRYWLYRSMWRPGETTIHILPHWNWEGLEGKNVPVYVYTNGDEAELFLNGRSLGCRRKGEVQKADPTKNDFRGNPYYEVCDRYRLRWLDVPYEPGELKVVVHKAGRELGVRTMKTAGKPVKVRLTPEQTVLPVDGSVVFCEIDVVDASGVRCPKATDRMSFRVDGPAELLSVSNGSASEHLSFVSFSGYPLYYGKACVTLRRCSGVAGSVRLIATSGNLTPAVAEFN